MKRIIELRYDKLVIGSDLDALSFSYVNKIPLIYQRLLVPPEINYKENKLWYNLMFVLSSTNYVPFSNLTKSIEIDEDTIKIVTRDEFIAKLKFNELIISDDYKLVLGVEQEPQSKVMVLDRFKVSGLRQAKGFKSLKIDEDNFASEIYESNKSILVKSNLTVDNLSETDYDPIIVRIKTEAYLKQSSTGMSKLKFIERNVYPLDKAKYTELPQNIKLLTQSFHDSFNCREVEDENIERLKKYYGIITDISKL